MRVYTAMRMLIVGMWFYGIFTLVAKHQWFDTIVYAYHRYWTVKILQHGHERFFEIQPVDEYHVGVVQRTQVLRSGRKTVRI